MITPEVSAPFSGGHDLRQKCESTQLDEDIVDTLVSVGGCLKDGSGRPHQFRLIMNTVLSSTRSCWLVLRKRSSLLTAYSSNALQISFAGWR